MIKFSPKERVLAGALANANSSITLDELLLALPEKYQGRKHMRRSAVVSMLRLRQKLLDEAGLRLERSTKLGRGNKASFELTSELCAFLKKQLFFSGELSNNESVNENGDANDETVRGPL